MAHARQCIECGLRTAKIVCQRCGGETDIDEYRIGDEPEHGGPFDPEDDIDDAGAIIDLD